MQPKRLARSLIRVSGPEAKAFLDNLLTQDLTRLADGGVAYAALLSPQGKVSADMLVWADGDALVLDVDPARGEALMKRLSMYKLRAQVTLEDAGEALSVLVSDAPFEGAVADPRLPALDWRALAPRGEHADGAAWYDAHRLALGVPDLARDAGPDEVFGLEALIEELNGVDFKKGCFVGQENVSRMKRRATTRKKFCPVVFDGPAPAFGSPVKAGEAELGSVRTGADGRAIALLRLDRAMDAASKAQNLTADGKILRIAPPDWLILPATDIAAD
jgi:folate-binding protein YgfZ